MSRPVPTGPDPGRKTEGFHDRAFIVAFAVIGAMLFLIFVATVNTQPSC